MLALVVATGAFGLLLMSSALLFSRGGSYETKAEDLPLRSVTVVPFVVKDDPSLAPAASGFAIDVARRLGAAMPQARVVAGTGEAGTRFRLEGAATGAGEVVEITLRVIDNRDGREVERARVSVRRAKPGEAGALLAPVAHRLLNAAMMRAAAD
jgi:hypothetical protein